ncbi:MAG: menaquinone biosynthetic enzyme MqnA/MqnD family protein [Pyrinomonadaceae bacterium]
MPTQTRISASSYSNTAPLIWSFLYGANHGKYELILDTAPARSAELLATGRVDAALVPVIAYQTIENVRLLPDVCVGAKETVRSVCLVTKGADLRDVKTVSLDISSKTSVALTKIIFRDFLEREPLYQTIKPNIETMLAASDCALLIGDPALTIDESVYRKFDLAETWKSFTDCGFVFAMWMTLSKSCAIDFAAARDEGLAHLDEIISNYKIEVKLSREDFKKYLSENISYSIDDSMRKGLELFFRLAHKNNLIENFQPLRFIA